MSNYLNMTVDFPSRVAELLSAFYDSSTAKGREVTFILAIAGPGITIPLERLCQSHPSHDFRYLPQLKEFKNNLEKVPFLKSQLWPRENPSSWCYGGPLVSVEIEPASWPELDNPRPLDNGPTSMKILRHIRNALSHGNVYTKGWPTISHLVFLSWISFEDTRYMYLVCSPNDFRLFFENWLSLLKPINLPSYVISEVLPAA